MAWFEQLEIHLHDLYLNNLSYSVDAFKPAFRSFFGEEHQTFKLKMFHNLDQLRLQLKRENLHEVNAKTCIEVLQTQFKEFFASKGDAKERGKGRYAVKQLMQWLSTESSVTKSDKQDTSSSSGNYTTQAVDADIGQVNDEEPFAEVQLTALHNILANEQQHTEQSEPSYDTHLLETIDSNTTPTSTNMCHRGERIYQMLLLKN
ncbi:hypothetical protein Tco_0670634 [Tanacetum coccineum]